MASSREYRDFILEQLSETEGIACRAMMGEYVLYVGGRVFGGIYDDRFLVKPVPSARARMPEAALEVPYEGASPMLLVDSVDDRAFLKELVEGMRDELPEPRRKGGKKP